MTRGSPKPEQASGQSVDAPRSTDTIGVKMFLALEDLAGGGPGPAIAPSEGAPIARLEEARMQLRQPDAGKITNADVAAVLEEIAAAHFGIEERT